MRKRLAGVFGVGIGLVVEECYFLAFLNQAFQEGELAGELVVQHVVIGGDVNELSGCHVV